MTGFYRPGQRNEQRMRRFMSIGGAGIAAPPGGADPYFANVSSLLHMDGTNGGTTFTDVTGKTWTVAGGAQTYTGNPKFGTASGLFTGSAITSAAHADFGFGTGDFTIEGWVFITVNSGDQCIFDNRNGSNTGIGIYASLAANSSQWGTSTNTAGTGSGFTIISNTWCFIAVCRESGTLRLYQNGVQRTSFADSRTYAATPGAVYGRNYLGSQALVSNALLDDWRITKGVCRYPGGTTFTPPTAAFPDS